MGNNAYIVNSRAHVDLTIGIGRYLSGNNAYLIHAKGLISAKWITWCSAKWLMVAVIMARLSIDYACRIGNGLSLGHRVVVFIWLSNGQAPSEFARPISIPAPRKN